jgi:hypothetical protein
VALEVLDKKILFLIDMVAHYSVLPASSGKPSSQTVFVVGVNGKNQIKNVFPPLPCLIETQIFIHRFLRVPSCPAPLLGWHTMKKLGVILAMGHLPGLPILQK